jgi:hypothetical protein
LRELVALFPLFAALIVYRSICFTMAWRGQP